jgi:hypothetical protein
VAAGSCSGFCAVGDFAFRSASFRVIFALLLSRRNFWDPPHLFRSILIFSQSKIVYVRSKFVILGIDVDIGSLAAAFFQFVAVG